MWNFKSQNVKSLKGRELLIPVLALLMPSEKMQLCLKVPSQIYIICKIYYIQSTLL